MKRLLDSKSFEGFYEFFVFDTSNQEDHIAAQLISIEFQIYEMGVTMRHNI